MKATSRSQRPKRVGVSPKSGTISGDEERSGRVTSSASRAHSARKGRGSALGYSKVISDTADASFCTAKGETSPVSEQPILASGTKSGLDSGGVGIESPVTFGAVVNSDCPSTLVKRMAGLRISEVQPDTPATVATILPGELYSNDVGEQNAARLMGSHEPSSPAVPRGLTFAPESGGSSVEGGMVASPADDSGLKMEAEKGMSPSKYLIGKECSNSSPRELGQVLKVPASASFDLRQAAEGDVNVDVDCERSAIFDEMLQTVSVANNPTEKSVVLSLVEKEAMELAASFVVEVERTTVAVPRTVSINEDSSQAGLINKESKVGINKIASKATSTNQEASQMGGANQEASQMGGANQEASQMGGANQEASQMGGANQEASQMGGANQEASQMGGAIQEASQMGGANQEASQMGGANQEAPRKSFQTKVFVAGADSGGNVDSAQMRKKLAVDFPVTTGAAQARKSGGNRRASFIPGSSSTSRFGKPQRKSVGDVSRVPEVAPESTERTGGPDGVVGTDVGATRKFVPDARAQRMQQTIRDQLSKGNSRRNSYNGNLRRGQSPKRLTVPEPFNLSTSTRPGSPSKTSKSREDCLTFAERMVHMETKVPKRFIRRPAGEQPKPAAPAPAPFHPEPTVPRSPNLRTEARATSNKSHFKTPMGREEEDLAYMKKHQFKARRYSSDGFGISGEKGVLSKHHSDKPLTRQEPFRLSTGSRPTRHATSQDDCEIFKQFKARPLPGSRSSSVGRGRSGAQFNPGSPVLRSSKVGGENTKSSDQVEMEESLTNQLKARPMPDYVKSRRQSVNPADKPVGLAEAKSSSLRTEERGKAKSVLLEHRRLAQRRQEEAVKKARARTRSSVVDLEHIRHERAAREFREKVRREEEETRLASKAKPFPRASKPAKELHLSTSSLTAPVTSDLKTMRRARNEQSKMP